MNARVHDVNGGYDEICRFGFDGVKVMARIRRRHEHVGGGGTGPVEFTMGI